MITVYLLMDTNGDVTYAASTSGEPIQVIFDNLKRAEIMEIETTHDDPGIMQDYVNDAAVTYGDYRINVQGTSPAEGVSADR